MTPVRTIALIAVAVVAIAVYASAFIVKEYETALKLRLGEIVASDFEPGLYFLVPIVNNVQTFDKRIQTMDQRPERFLTIEKKDVIVDSYIKFRIIDVAQFYRSTGGGNIARASALMSERINSSLRNEFGKRTIREVVSGERGEIMDLLRKDADEKAAELGLEIVDVRVKKIDLPREVSESVFGRMRAERERVASELRAEGEEAAEKIRANADRERTVILANAFREAEQLRGDGDSKAAEIYAQAFEEDREFYAFYRSMDAYRRVFADGSGVMVLEPESDFFRYFNSQEGRAKPQEGTLPSRARPSP
jgi:membrane protease subunit HflC